MSLFNEILRMSAVSVPIILFIILIRFVLSKAPKFFSYILWIIVLFRLLCPVSFTSDFSFLGIFEKFDYVSVRDTSPSEPATEIHQQPVDLPFAYNNELLDLTPDNHIPEVPDNSKTNFTNIILPTIWIIGVFVMLIHSIVQLILLRRRLLISLCIDDNVYAADHIPTAFVIGLINPKIYLPSGISESEYKYIIKHEKYHIKRGDHFFKAIAYLALSLHWFNPFVWLAFFLAVRDMELSCDEAIIGNLKKSDRASYSYSLLSLSSGIHSFSPTPLAFGEGNTKSRVKNVMKFRKPTSIAVVVLTVICICTFLFLISNPSKENIDSPFGKTYNASEITYRDSSLSMIITVENAPKIILTEDNTITLSSNNTVYVSLDSVKSYGPAEKIRLTEENFDKYFAHISSVSGGWTDDSYSAPKLRRNNLSAWQFTSNDNDNRSFYILQQKNGDIYFAEWVYDPERENDPHSDDSYIHTLYKLSTVQDEEIQEFTFDFSDAKRYMYSDSIESVMKPTVTLSEKNKLFHFSYSMFSSYIAHGHYTEENGKIIMDCGDGKVFTFRKEGDDTLIFEQKNSSPIPKYRYSSKSYVSVSPVPDGAVFTKLNVIDNIVEISPLPDENEVLEKAVSSAILHNYRDDKPDGLIHTESHIILDTGELHGLRTIEGKENISKKQAYTISMHTSYSIDGDNLKIVSCDFAPAIITFVINPDGSLTFDKYFIPAEKNDKFFKKYISNYYTENSYEEALDYEKYRDEFNQNCYEKASKILIGYTTDYTDAEHLITTICSSPEWSSSPADYINEHPAEYEKLIEGKNNTLGYCFSKFIAGNQNGLEGHIMAQACRVIIERLGEPVTWSVYDTGQEWFDDFYEKAKKLKEEYTPEEFETLFPGSFIVLGTVVNDSSY